MTIVFDETHMAAGPGDVSARAIEREAVVDLPAPEVWRLWTTEAGLTDWLVGGANVSLAVGGPYELFFATDAPEGERGGEGCRVLSYLPERIVSFTWNAPPSFPEEREKRTWVVVELEPAGGDATRVRLTHLGWPKSGLDGQGRWGDVFAYFERAWTSVMKALEAYASERAEEG